MKEKFKNYLRNLTTVIFILSLCGCVSWVEFNGEIKLPELAEEDKLPNMTFVPLCLYDVKSSDNMINEAETLMDFSNSIKKSLMKTSEPETGYFCFKLLEDDYQNWNYSIWGGGFIHGLLCGIPTLLGVPTDIKQYGCNIILYFFDSNGNLIEEFSGERWITRSAGLYYGYRCKRDYAVKSAFKEIQKKLSKSIYSINDALCKAGPNSADNEEMIKEKIRERFEEELLSQVIYRGSTYEFHGKKYKDNNHSVYYSTSNNNSTTNTVSEAAQTLTNSMRSPLKGGRYDAVGIPNCYATITPLGSSGTLNMFLGGSSASGDYKIDGSQIVVNYMFANGDFSSKKGCTEIYQILSETRFRTGGTVFVYSGY